MIMDFDMERFERIIEEQKVETVNENYGYNYALMVLINNVALTSIDFKAFDDEDIIDLLNEIEEAITDENEDGEVSIDPNHPYGRMISLSHKISKLSDVPKIRPTSPFRFL